MWLPLILFVFAGLVSADFDHGWKVGNEYTYMVRSRTLTGLREPKSHYTGVLVKAVLKVQVKDRNTLAAELSHAKYADIHKDLPNGWDSHIPDQQLNLRDLPVTGKPFEIKIKHGVVRDLIVDKSIPTWELNMLKSVVSQLQIDTLGENALRNKENIQIPGDEQPYASFSVMEDSVGGTCEVLYDITPLTESALQREPELVPIPKLKGDGHHLDISKIKNFTRCDQRVDYHFGITGQNKWEPGTNDNGGFLTKSASSRVVISGNLKRFTIQSSVTTSEMYVSPRFYDYQTGIVMTRMNLTLGNVERIGQPIAAPSEPESTGNLVYAFDNPFTTHNDRRPGINNVINEDRDTDRSNESLENQQDDSYLQPKPTLEDASRYPLLPFFVGSKGKSIEKSGEIDPVKAAKQLIVAMANELENPNAIPEENTLEKFTILTSLLRTMNRKQIQQIENELQISHHDLKAKDKSQAVKQNGRSVFKDAVTQAGTGPALLTIRDWIMNKDVTPMEGADILSRIAKTARTPTKEYIDTLFELATNEEVKRERHLNASAIFAFTELVHQTHINRREMHNRFPVHAFGRLMSKSEGREVVTKYIPYLSNELQRAMKEKDSVRIQTYIVALGSIGHPKILSEFEPFLEGKEPSTVFQRVLIVASLGKLSETHPRLLQSVLYKIYLNTMESHEVRCVAVFLLMKTNPSVGLLQRMAKFTNYDTSKHVNSAVKSSINALASLQDPEYIHLARRAKAAVNLLNPEKYGYQYSRQGMDETVKQEHNVKNLLLYSYIGSTDTLIPKAFYTASYNSYGDFKVPANEFGVMLSSVRNVIDMVLGRNEEEQRGGKRLTEKLADELNIEPEEPEKLEGNLMWDNKFSTGFIPFDANTIRKIRQLVSREMASFENTRYLNVNKLMSYEVTLSFPTETGLPFVFTFKVPILYKAQGQGQLYLSENKSMNLKVDTRLVVSQKIQGRVGFLAPFESKHYIAGVDMNFQMYAPFRFSLDMERPMNIMKLKLWPLSGEEKARLVHSSVIPYTSSHEVLNLKPLTHDEATETVRSGETEKQTKFLPMQDIDIIKVELTGDKKELLDQFDIQDILKAPWTQSNDKDRSGNLYLNVEPGQKEPLIISWSTDEMTVADQGSEKSWNLQTEAQAPSETRNREIRKKDYLKEVGKGIRLAKSKVVDIDLKFMKSESVMTIAWANSEVDNKNRVLVFTKLGPQKEDVQYEVCMAYGSNGVENTIPSYEMAKQRLPKEEFDMDLRYGPSCSKGERLNVKGQVTQSQEKRRDIENSKLVKECQEQMKQGDKILRKCQNAAAAANIWDELEFTVTGESTDVPALIDSGLQMIDEDWYQDKKLQWYKSKFPRNQQKNRVDFKIKFNDNYENADMDVNMPGLDIYIKRLDTWYLDLADMTEDNIEDALMDKLESTCVLDKTRAETFDGKEYRLKLGNCWHAVMTTYPKRNPENRDEKMRIPKDESVSILAKETQDGRKEIKILLGNQEIKLQPGTEGPVAIVNQKSVEITKNQAFQEKRDGQVMIEISRMADGSLILNSDEFDVRMIYDGERILIKASQDYRNSVRGLCGNFDGDMMNEFLAPQNCVMRKPEHFIASYALTQHQCEGESLENAKVADKECQAISKIRHSNVINDVEAGRENTQSWSYGRNEETSGQCNAHRTLVKEQDDKICFSMRPVTECKPGCSPVETKSKNYQFHCMERNETSLKLKERIEKGANPDLSQKTVSMSERIQVPISCKA